MRLTPILAFAFALASTATLADTTVHYDWLTQGEVSGELVLTRHDDGARSVHFEFNDRGRGPFLDTRFEVDGSGRVRHFESRGKAYMGAPVEEVFTYEDGVAEWRSTLESGEARSVSLDAFYLANDSSPEYLAAMARALLAAPGQSLPIWPVGTASIEKLAEETVAHNGESKLASLYAINGLGFDPQYLWLDEEQELFALAMGWMGLVPQGWAEVLPALDARQQSAERAQLADRAAALTHELPDAYCLRDFRVLDVDAGRLRDASTVRVEDGLIKAVGANDSIDCSGLSVLEGQGRSLIPGLWDMHVHVGATDGALHVAAGVTSVRDLANTHERLMETIGQFQDGTAIGPDVYRAGFIDAAGPFAAPTGNLAESLDEALGYIEQIHEQGYRHIKIYSSIHPEWVAPMAAAIHERGMRISGHVPSGMSAEAAIRDGFDEIQHINMVFLNFLAGPDDDTRTPVRFVLVAEEGGDLDLDSEEVQAFIDLLVREDVVVDPTVAIFDDMFRHRSGEVSPSYAMIADHLPPNVRRSMLGGRMDINEENAERYAASAQALLDMIRRLHEAGVPLVAGTDALPGFTLHRELELYVQAGIPNAEVLRLATIGSAELLGEGDAVGRIAPGYRADLVALDGDPLDDIRAIRRAAMTLQGQRLYRPADIHRALGIKPFAEPFELDD
ncbi:amidohydrolase family protein [Wenzhouxiangella marina]|uniref:Amidohydrolase n=1 Tax=Wenzhouxiangella marina TaxID=1579979 RepID=A0A0K0XU32_9GAMM|nr:amidohydrolase family protein [Wenzhouxiangella marina]AKS41193.1 Amidohydrolase [Wenzhouxiangella marina]MBB6088072.1 cytosine/adenosine deaminase-related metal-dependent hydrolase [Wenzhouxiangella marina]